MPSAKETGQVWVRTLRQWGAILNATAILIFFANAISAMVLPARQTPPYTARRASGRD